MILESNKYYLISEYRIGKKKIDNYFGKLNLKNNIVKSYYNYVYTNNLKIISKLSLKYKLKKISLIKENNKIKRNIK